MQAIVLEDVGRVAIRSVEVPTVLESTDAVVRVSLAALCGSDIHLFTGKDEVPDAGTVMGHEFVGTISAVGSAVHSLSPGDRVVSPFTTCCGACWYCNQGLTARCEQGLLFGWRRGDVGLHGAQAQYVRVPLADATLVKVASLPWPAGVPLPDVKAVLLGDIIPTGLFAAENAGVGLHTGSNIAAVVGCGPVGLMAVCAAIHRGARRVFAIDRVEDRLQLAAEFGAEPLRLGGGGRGARGDDGSTEEERVLEALAAATDGRGADCVLEVVGHPSALGLAFRLARPGGTVSSIGVYGDQEAFPFKPVDCYNRNITFRSGRCPARRFMDEEAPKVAARFPVERIISHVVGFKEAAGLYRDFCDRKAGCTKVAFDPWKD